MEEDKLMLYIPLISRAGSYNKKPLIDGYGQVEVYINYETAERAGMIHIDKQPEEEALNLMLHVGELEIASDDESMIQHERWEN